MTIEPGQHLLHYRLVEQIGEGGMGVVWKAVDTTLDREVAIKVLPQAFAESAERLTRFEREAKLLASLNHPNIAAVYGLHEGPSTDSGPGLRFIAMELVGGEDLSQRLARGPMPVAEALAIGVQIAEGLAAAHEAGVIHRDLKPANVKLTVDGKVKVLDFGLAKAFDLSARSGEVDLSRSPTMTSAGTMAGVIMGTAAYMSPEQARGRPTDRRTDIWGFGALLFEMLAGRPPFPGEVVSEIIAKILERDPAWEALPAPLHPGVRRLLERCLTKDPDARLRDAADMRLELRDLLADPAGERVVRSAAGAAGAPTPAWRRVLPWAIAAALLVALVAALALRPDAFPGRLVRFELNPPTGHQFGEFTASSDGTAVVFVASNREGTRSLWVRRLDSTENVRLPGTDGASFPFWSPDGTAVAFFSGGALRRIDLASGTIQSIAAAPNGRGGAWGHDGTILFTPEGADVLYTVPSSGGTPQPRTTMQPPEATHRFPHFVGDSRTYTYLGHDQDSADTKRRYLASLDSDETIPLVDGLSELYAPPGYALYVRESTLFAQPFDARSGALSGEPFPLARGIDDTFPRTGRSAFSVSDNGVLTFLESRTVDTRIDAYDRGGRRLETVVPGGAYDVPVLSRDGRQIAFLRDAMGNRTSWTLWRMDLDRLSAAKLLEIGPAFADVAWSADGRGIIYSLQGVMLRAPAAGGEPEVILDGAQSEQRQSLIALSAPDEAPDGSFLVFAAWDPVTDYDLWLLRFDGDREPLRLIHAPGFQGNPTISPDTRFIAYESDESGRFEIYVRTPDASSRAWLVSTDGGASPVWSADGRELYYVAADYGIMSVSIDRSAGGFRAGLPVRLFDGPLSVEEAEERFFRQPYLAGIEGDRFLFHVPNEELRDRTIEVVLNWERLLAP